jgi:lipopolysaccharide transport protein LptA
MSAAERGGRLKLRAARVIRPILIVLLATVVVVITVYLIRQIGRVPPPEPGKKDILETKVDRKEKIRVSQTHRGKGLIEASGALNVPVDEKTYRLEGGVEVVDHGRKGGREIRMNGDVLTYDKEMNHFFFKGNVRIRFKDVTMSGPDFEYNRLEDLIMTGSGAAVRTSALDGEAQRVLFSLKDEELVLEENMQFSIRLRLATPDPLVISGRKLAYGFLRRRGDVEGGGPDGKVGLVHGKSRGTAEHLYFEQWEKIDDLRLLRLQGNVRLALEEERAAAKTPKAAQPTPAPEAQESSINREFRLDQSVRQEMESDEIKLQSFLNLPSLRLIECRGRSAIKFLYDSGEATEFRGEAIDLNFSRAGGFREIKTAGMARIAGLDKTGGVSRVIEGASMTLDGQNSVLHVTADAGRRARLVSARSDVSGDDLTIMIEQDDFEMKGGVQMNFRPSPKDAADKGFFSSEGPIFAKAGSMRYLSRFKRFLLWDQVRTWQEQRILSAQEISLSEDMAEMTCQGGVQSVFPHKAKEGEPERRVEIAAGKMRYDSGAHQLIYEDNCQLRSGAAVLQSGIITVDPGEGGGEIRSFRATKGKSKVVTIVMNAREGTGELAEYDVQKDTITLTGRPELKEKDKGTVRGDKLTFHLADGTIRVESRDQERPVPVIKS